MKAVPGKTPGNGNANGSGSGSGNGNPNGPLLSLSGSRLPATAQQARTLAKNPHYAGTSGSGSASGTPGAGTASNQDNFLYYYHPDHLGSSSYVTDAAGKVFEHLEYFPFGETWVEENSNTQRTPYLFTAKELDEETGLYYFGARYYDPRVSVWQSADPILGGYLNGNLGLGGIYAPKNLALFGYAHLNPMRLLDRDGNSTTIDSDGNVTGVNVTDGDRTVYQSVVKGLQGPPAPIGTTKNLDEFVSPETGKPYTSYKLQMGKSFNPIIDGIAAKAKGMNLVDIAKASRPRGSLDIKVKYAGVGALLNGEYATSRSAGNYLAGKNAAIGTLMGRKIEFDTFQRLAGALQVFDAQGKKMTEVDMAGIVMFNKAYGPAPAYGENMYQYRMSKDGWESVRPSK